MQLFLTTKIWKEGKHYVSYCPELEVASQGKTEEQARNRIRKAVELFLEETKRMGTLPEILRFTGFSFSKKKKEWIAPFVFISPFRVKV